MPKATIFIKMWPHNVESCISCQRLSAPQQYILNHIPEARCSYAVPLQFSPCCDRVQKLLSQQATLRWPRLGRRGSWGNPCLRQLAAGPWVSDRNAVSDDNPGTSAGMVRLLSDVLLRWDDGFVVIIVYPRNRRACRWRTEAKYWFGRDWKVGTRNALEARLIG